MPTKGTSQTLGCSLILLLLATFGVDATKPFHNEEVGGQAYTCKGVPSGRPCHGEATTTTISCLWIGAVVNLCYKEW